MTINEPMRLILELSKNWQTLNLSTLDFYKDPDQRKFFKKRLMTDLSITKEPLELITHKGNEIKVHKTLQLIKPSLIRGIFN